MNNKICLFHDYLSDIHPKEKIQILKKLGVEVFFDPEETLKDDKRKHGFTHDLRHQYADTIQHVRRVFGRFAPNALSAITQAHGDFGWSDIFSSRHKEFFKYLGKSSDRLIPNIPKWAIDPWNWFYVNSSKGTYELQSDITSMFPCTVINDVPLECLSPSSLVKLENIEEILRTTGIYQAWENKNFGENSKVVIFDTGVSSEIESMFKVELESISGLSKYDNDGHGSAVSELVLAIAPKAKLKSFKVLETYSEGTIWNLISGITSLYNDTDLIINISLGVNPIYINSLGPGAVSFKEAINNIITSASSQRHFIICASGNDGASALRWPAAANDSLAVGSYNSLNLLSSFSNYSETAANYIVAPGGEIRTEDHTMEIFGKYGNGLSRDIFGTSFSCAISSGISALLHDYGWFKSMDIPSRLSLFRNHCRKNKNGFPVLNISDIGAIWPLRKNEGIPFPIELLFELLKEKRRPPGRSSSRSSRR